MSGLSINRRFTSAVPTALDAKTNTTDNDTGSAILTLNTPNAILDIINDPDPAGRYEVQVWKNGKDTGRRFFSGAMSTSSDGRSKIPAPGLLLEPGQLQFFVVQKSGALAAISFVVTFKNDF